MLRRRLVERAQRLLVLLGSSLVARLDQKRSVTIQRHVLQGSVVDRDRDVALLGKQLNSARYHPERFQAQFSQVRQLNSQPESTLVRSGRCPYSDFEQHGIVT